jgi:hypothetical protein
MRAHVRYLKREPETATALLLASLLPMSIVRERV